MINMVVNPHRGGLGGSVKCAWGIDSILMVAPLSWEVGALVNVCRFSDCGELSLHFFVLEFLKPALEKDQNS